MICVIVIAVVITAALGVTALKFVGSRYADRTLLLMCETGQKNLDNYFHSIEQSTGLMSAYVESDLDGLEDEKLQAHLARVSIMFDKLHKANGVLTYYYRIDPAVSQRVTGFWHINYDEGILNHEVTDISLYDTSDTSKLVWFTVPKATRQPVWVPPYVTENLGARVISYNIPIHYQGRFVGVVGIEVDYSFMAQMVDHIALHNNGYAFLNDEKGRILYHPRMDVLTMKEQPTVPSGLLDSDKFIHYTFEGIEKQAVWLPLENGMRLNLTAPVKEINEEWNDWRIGLIAASTVLLAGFVMLAKTLIERIMGA